MRTMGCVHSNRWSISRRGTLRQPPGGTWGGSMLRRKSVLIGSLLVVCQLGCDSGSLQVGPPGGLPPPNPQANISILPANAVVGSADLTLTITGSKTFQFAGGGPRYNKVLWS